LEQPKKWEIELNWQNFHGLVSAILSLIFPQETKAIGIPFKYQVYSWKAIYFKKFLSSK